MKTKPYLSALFLIVSFQIVCAQTPKTAEDYNNRGLERRSKGDISGAIEDYTKAIETRSAGANVSANDLNAIKDISGFYLNRAIAKHDKKDLDGSVADLTEAIRLNPRYSDAYNQRGIARHDKGELEEAIADYSKAIEIDPNNAKAYMNLGNVWNDKREFEKAITDFNRALLIDPNDAFAYANRCVSQTKKEVFKEAMNDCNKALSINPQFAEAYLFRGDLRDDMNDFDGAIQDYSKAIEIRPNYTLAYLDRGLARADKKDSSGAIPDFNKAIDIDPSDAGAYGARALALLSLGRDSEAEQDLKKCFELKPALRGLFEPIANQIRRQRTIRSSQIESALLEPVTAKTDLYPSDADAKKEIDEAVKSATTDHKRVLLVFGGNWCYDCHVLDRALHEGAAGQVVKESFLLVHVDIGEVNKNLDLAKQYKIPLEKGVPAIAILGSDGKLLYSSGDGEFEAARRMMKKDLVRFLNRWKGGAPQ